MKTRAAALLIALLAALPASATAQSAVVSTFDADAEGWTVFGDAQGNSATPTYNATGGNPGGYLPATDNTTGGVWYFSAPPKFLGDQTGAYGRSLRFHLRQSPRTRSSTPTTSCSWGRAGSSSSTPPGTPARTGRATTCRSRPIRAGS